jgi:hypothetical protein
VTFDRATLQKLLAGLGNRVFLMNNVHEDHPVVFQVRWVMSYLSGPLSRNLIKKLMDPVRPAKTNGTDKGGDDGFAPPGASQGATAEVRNTIKPRLPEGVEEHFLRASGGVGAEHLIYVPAMLRSAEVLFEDAKKGISGKRVVTLANEIDVKGQRVNWDKFIELPRDLEVAKFEGAPEEGAAYSDLPGAALKSGTYSSIEKDFIDELYNQESIEVFFSALIKAYSNPGETEGDFKSRVAHAARELRDKAVDDLKAKSAKAMKSLETKVIKAMDKLEAQKSQASSAKMATFMKVGSSILGALLGGRKSGLASVASSTTVTGVSRAWQQGKEADAAEAELERVKAELAELEVQTEEAVQKVKDQYELEQLVLEKIRITPLKKNIQPKATGILWLPHEEVRGDLRPAWERFS